MTVRGSVPARTFGLLAMSAAGHVIVFTALGLVPSPSRVLAMHEAQFEVLQPNPPPVEPPQLKEPDPPPREPPKVATRAATPKAAPPPQAEAPAPADEVTDFTGVTLTAEGGSSWATAVGTGAPLTGPIGKIGRGKLDGQQLSAKAAPSGPRLVALGSLARKPAPPAGLVDLLKQNYPRRAQLQGVEGRAVVRVRILPNGHVGEIRVVEESPAAFEFAAACRDTLRQAPPWQPPLDGSGKAVATEITFNCAFEVGY